MARPRLVKDRIGSGFNVARMVREGFKDAELTDIHRNASETKKFYAIRLEAEKC